MRSDFYRQFYGSLVVLLLLTLFSRGAVASVITIGASKDNTIFQNNVNNSLGGGQAIFSGTNGSNSPRRGLIAFDVAGSSIPAGSTITGVTLTLYLNQVAGSGGGTGTGGVPNGTIELHDLLEDWGEGTAGNTTSGAGGTAQGFAAGVGDATWNARLYSPTTPTAWTNPGGDASSTISASLVVGTTLNQGYVWGSTAQMVADVQSWLDSPATNFGWMLKNADETSTQTFRAFWTREETRTDAQSQFVPQLQITYVPEPVGMLVAAIGVIGLCSRRRTQTVEISE